MLKNVDFTELEDIHYKYERLQSMIGILQMFTAEIIEIAGHLQIAFPMHFLRLKWKWERIMIA